MGDWLTVAQRAPLRVSYGEPRPAWVVDTDGVRDACAQLGIEQPLSISPTDSRGGKSRAGVHRWERGEHVITVLRRLTPESASRVLWHELEHARQLERDFDGDDDAFGRAYRADRDFYEHQARASERMHEFIPLAY